MKKKGGSRALMMRIVRIASQQGFSSLMMCGLLFVVAYLLGQFELKQHWLQHSNEQLTIVSMSLVVFPLYFCFTIRFSISRKIELFKENLGVAFGFAIPTIGTILFQTFVAGIETFVGTKDPNLLVLVWINAAIYLLAFFMIDLFG